MENAEKESRALLATDQPWWPTPIVRAAEARASGSALACVSAAALRVFALPGVEPRDAPDLVRELVALLEKGGAAPSDLLARSEAIWYAPGGRDGWRTGVSNLWAAAAFPTSQGSKHVLTLGAVLANLIYGAPEGRRAEVAEAIFDSFTKEIAAGS